MTTKKLEQQKSWREQHKLEELKKELRRRDRKRRTVSPRKSKEERGKKRERKEKERDWEQQKVRSSQAVQQFKKRTRREGEDEGVSKVSGIIRETAVLDTGRCSE